MNTHPENFHLGPKKTVYILGRLDSSAIGCPQDKFEKSERFPDRPIEPMNKLLMDLYIGDNGDTRFFYNLVINNNPGHLVKFKLKNNRTGKDIRPF